MAKARRKFEIGDTAFLVESNRDIHEVKILKCTGSFYTIRFTDRPVDIKVREHLHFAT